MVNELSEAGKAAQAAKSKEAQIAATQAAAKDPANISVGSPAAGGALGTGGFGAPRTTGTNANFAPGPQGDLLKKLYAESGVVVDSGGNVLYNPADLGSSQEAAARQRLGLPTPTVRGTVSNSYIASVRAAGGDISKLQKQGNALLVEAQQKQQEAIQLQQRKQAIEKEIENLDTKISSYTPTFSKRPNFGGPLGGYNPDPDPYDKTQAIQERTRLQSQLSTVNANISSIGLDISNIRTGQRNVQKAENSANYNRLFVDEKKPTVQAGARAGIKSVVPPLQYQELKGTKITARELQAAKGNPDAMRALQQKELFRQVTSQKTALEAYGIQKAAQQKGEGTKQKYIGSYGERDPFGADGFVGQNAEKIAALKRAGNLPASSGSAVFGSKFANPDFAQKGSAAYQGIKPELTQEPVTIQVSNLAPIKEPIPKFTTNTMIGLTENLNIEAKRIQRAGQKTKPTNYNLGLPSGRIDIVDENDQFTGVTGSISAIFGEKKQESPSLKSIDVAAKYTLTKPAQREGEPLDVIKEFANTLETRGRTLAAVPTVIYKDITQGYGAGQKYFEKEVQPTLKETAFDSLLSGQPSGLTERGRSGSITADALLLFAPGLVGKGVTKGATPKTSTSVAKPTTINQKIYRPTNIYRGQVPRDVYELDKASTLQKTTISLGTAQVKTRTFVQTKVPLGLGIGKAVSKDGRGSTSITSLFGGKPGPGSSIKPYQPSSKARQQLVLEKKPEQVKQQPFKQYPVQLGESKVSLVRTQTLAQKADQKYLDDLIKSRKQRLQKSGGVYYQGQALVLPRSKTQAIQERTQRQKLDVAQRLKPRQVQRLTPIINQKQTQQQIEQPPPIINQKQTQQQIEQPPPRRTEGTFKLPPFKLPFPYGGIGSGGRGPKRVAKKKFVTYAISAVIPRGRLPGSFQTVSSSSSIFRDLDIREKKALKGRSRQGGFNKTLFGLDVRKNRKSKF